MTFRMNFSFAVFALIAFMLLFLGEVSSALAQFDEPEIPEQVVFPELALEPSDPRPGEQARVVVRLRLHEGWHIYSVVPAEGEFAPIPTTLNVGAGPLEKIGPIYESNPRTDNDPVLGMVLSFHKKEARLFQNLHVPETAAPGAFSAQAELRFQACSDRVCLTPKTLPLTTDFMITAGPVRPEYSFAQYAVDEVPDAESVPTSELESALSEGVSGFLGLAVVAGLLALLTPCVFPMIPITVAYFTKQGESGSTVRLASLFGSGIIGTYTVTGMGLSVLLGATGAVQLATNGWVNLAIGLLFLAFGFSLMGYFELRLPAGVGTHADQWSRRYGGAVGVLLMGLVFTLTSFTCTVQFVGTMLIAASQGHWLWPLVGMLVFATVFAFPFFLLGLFPRWIQKLRGQSGDWMDHLKVVLGLLELAAAFKFLSNADLVWQWGVLDRDFVIVAWLTISVLTGLFLLGGFTVHHVRVQARSLTGMVGAAGFLVLGIYLGRGLGNVPLNPWVDTYLPPALAESEPVTVLRQRPSQSNTGTQAPLTWHSQLGEALALARQQNRRVFIDFTGYTCVNCRWMEKNVFENPEVRDRFHEKFVLVQLYTDGGADAEANQLMQVERFHTIALPFYVILSPDDQVLARHAGILKPAQAFLNFLDAQES
ncbi:MAG: hypothetical protein CL911_04115 [Deltaproteobacteria bacterium]|nr:hypothetical protein [Deltaproteobacteria bacterium]